MADKLKKDLYISESGSKADFISCSNCSKKLDWEQINYEGDKQSVYDVYGWCVNCYHEKLSEEEIDEEIKES